MADEEELRAVADAVDRGVVVAGTGRFADVVAGRTPGTDASADSDVDAVVLVIDPSEPDPATSVARWTGGPDRFVVAVVGAPADDGSVDPDLLDAVRAVADATLLVPVSPVTRASGSDTADVAPAGEGDGVADADGVVDGALDFVAVVRDPGFVNLDLADARTVLGTGTVAALGRGSASLSVPGAPEAAVSHAFEAMPAGVEPDRAPAALVDVVAGPAISVADATAAVTAVRERVGSGVHVVWGGAVEEAAADELHVRVVVADVDYAPTPAPDDPCPRCGAALSAYSFGERTTLSCDSCGYAGLSTPF